MTIGIYKITEKSTGRCYVGQSKHIERRWKVHHDRFPIDKFDYEILVTCPIKDLNELEVLMISTFDSHINGFNKTIGGAYIKVRIIDDETKAKMSAMRKGRKHSESTKAKMRKADKSYMQTEAYKATQRNRDYSFMKTESYRQKMKEAQIRRRIREGNWKGGEQ